MTNVIASGALMSKTIELAYSLFEELTSNNYQCLSKRTKPKPILGILELDHMNNIASQLVALNKRFDKFEIGNINAIQTTNVCGDCAGEHSMTEFPLVGASTFKKVEYLKHSNR